MLYCLNIIKYIALLYIMVKYIHGKMVVYLFFTLFSGFFASLHGWSSPRGISYKHFIYTYFKSHHRYWNILKHIRFTLTWYSVLNPTFSFADMFVICAFMFLIEMFLFVGSPLLVFSGRAYVVSPMLFACRISDLQPIIWSLSMVCFVLL